MKGKRILIVSLSFIVLGLSTVLAFYSIPIALVVSALSLLFMGLGLFEQKSASAEKVVLLAILTAVASAGRVLFVSLPVANPVSFIVIMSALAFGPHFGFMVGALSALVSNMILGHGPWTLWQMLLWGLMGFISGWLHLFLSKHKWIRAAYGFLWGFLFGWAMNLYHVFSGYMTDAGIGAFFLASASSFFFDLMHAVSSFILLIFLGDVFIKIFKRTALKYGLKD